MAWGSESSVSASDDEIDALLDRLEALRASIPTWHSRNSRSKTPRFGAGSTNTPISRPKSNAAFARSTSSTDTWLERRLPTRRPRCPATRSSVYWVAEGWVSSTAHGSCRSGAKWR